MDSGEEADAGELGKIETWRQDPLAGSDFEDAGTRDKSSGAKSSDLAGAELCASTSLGSGEC